MRIEDEIIPVDVYLFEYNPFTFSGIDVVYPQLFSTNPASSSQNLDGSNDVLESSSDIKRDGLEQKFESSGFHEDATMNVDKLETLVTDKPIEELQ
jgi:hypothetical protein